MSSAPASTEIDTTATEQIESIYARIGLASANDRARYLVGNRAAPAASFEVVISSTSQPFGD